MSEEALHCPSCGRTLSPVSRRGDYFCRGCHAAVSLLDNGFALYQSDVRYEEVLLPLSALGNHGGEADGEKR